jgi:hypothetical protein
VKITIGLTKKAEALMRELVLGESTVVAAQQRELAEWQEVAEGRRQHALEAERKLAESSTRLRQAQMLAEGAETRLEQAEATLTSVRALAMEAVRQVKQGTIDAPGVMGTDATLEAIIRATRK